MNFVKSRFEAINQNLDSMIKEKFETAVKNKDYVAGILNRLS